MKQRKERSSTRHFFRLKSKLDCTLSCWVVFNSFDWLDQMFFRRKCYSQSGFEPGPSEPEALLRPFTQKHRCKCFRSALMIGTLNLRLVSSHNHVTVFCNEMQVIWDTPSITMTSFWDARFTSQWRHLGKLQLNSKVLFLFPIRLFDCFDSISVICFSVNLFGTKPAFATVVLPRTWRHWVHFSSQEHKCWQF